MTTDGHPGPAARNRLLATLPRADSRRLLPHLEPVVIGMPAVLYEPGMPMAHVYFPADCVFSLLTVLQDGTAVEGATVGNEGLLGLPVVLGIDIVPVRVLCQLSGTALRMPATAFRDELTTGGALARLVQRYTYVLFNQIAQSVACNQRHSIRQRCARWLLATHDRVGGDGFGLTQEFLAAMLHVRRASVNEAAGLLRDTGCIRYWRGQVTILDRQQLEAAACECYRVVRAHYDSFLT